MNIKFRFRAPATIRMALCCLAAGLCMSFTASAQEYTLRDLVEEYDAMIVARIDSKEAMEKTVKISGHDGVISTAQEIFTIHEITLSEYVGPEGFAGIRGFVLPGGKIGKREVIYTHTPELNVGWEVLVAIDYNELNDYYSLGGIPPVGRPGAVFISKEIQGRKVFIPYSRKYEFENADPSALDLGRMTTEVRSSAEMLNLARSYMIDYDAFLTAIGEAANEIE